MRRVGFPLVLLLVPLTGPQLDRQINGSGQRLDPALLVPEMPGS